MWLDLDDSSEDAGELIDIASDYLELNPFEGMVVNLPPELPPEIHFPSEPSQFDIEPEETVIAPSSIGAELTDDSYIPIAQHFSNFRIIIPIFSRQTTGEEEEHE